MTAISQSAPLRGKFNWLRACIFLVIGGILAAVAFALHWHHLTTDARAFLFGVSAILIVAPFIPLIWAEEEPVRRDLRTLANALAHETSTLKQSTTELGTTLGRHMSELRQSTLALQDLHTAQIIRIHPSRDMERDERAAQWAHALADAGEIDLMGLSLWDHWFRYSVLRDGLAGALSRGATVRILLPAPGNENPSWTQRLAQPGEKENSTLLEGYFDRTKSYLEAIQQGPQVAGGKLLVCFVAKTTLYSMIVRIDDYMFVSFYRAAVVGEDSLALEVRGPASPVFVAYKDEFETVLGEEQ